MDGTLNFSSFLLWDVLIKRLQKTQMGSLSLEGDARFKVSLTSSLKPWSSVFSIYLEKSGGAAFERDRQFTVISKTYPLTQDFPELTRITTQIVHKCMQQCFIRP